MTAATVLGACWASLVLVRAWSARPPRVGHRPDLPVAPPSPRGPTLADRTGAALVALAARAGGPVASVVTDADPARLGRSALAAAATAALVAPAGVVPAVALGAAVAAVSWGAPALGARRRGRRDEEAIRRDLPQVVDLLALAVGAGLTVPLAIAAVTRHATGPVGEAFDRALVAAGVGLPLVDALGALPDRLGDEVRPLVRALVASLREGAALGDGLDRLAAELRATRRRRAEEAARRVPVALLFPLVCCILPAFALLTVAPLLAGAFGSLRP